MPGSPVVCLRFLLSPSCGCNTGEQVAMQAADRILTDDNFTSVVEASSKAVHFRQLEFVPSIGTSSMGQPTSAHRSAHSCNRLANRTIACHLFRP